MDGDDGGWVGRPCGFFSPLEVAASVPTTMARAAELAAAGAPEGATVVTEEQTEGRGRLGRAWVAPPGSSLLLSVVLRPPPREAVWLTVAAAAVALAGAVDEAAPGRPRPASSGPTTCCSAAQGGRAAGRGPPGGRAAGRRPARHGRQRRPGGGRLREVAAAATSVASPPALTDQAALLAAWAGRFLAGYADLCAGGRAGAGRLPVAPAHRRPARPGRAPGRRPGGTAVDLTPTGGLVVQTASGARVEVLAGDVHHLRPTGPAGRSESRRSSAGGRLHAVGRCSIRRCRRSIPRCCAGRSGPRAPGRRWPRSAACATAARPGCCGSTAAAPRRDQARGGAAGGRRRGPGGAAHRGGGAAAGRRARRPGAAAARRRGRRRPAGGPGRAGAGSSAIPAERPAARLRTLGRTAAALADRPGPRSGAAPARPADRQRGLCRPAPPGPPRPPAAGGRGAVWRPRRGEPEVFVHGDPQGNALWDGDRLTGLIDWDCAGAGPPRVDLGSLRCDAALCFGPEAATTSWPAGRRRPAGPRWRWPTGTWWPPSARRPTWAGSPGPSPARAAPTSPGGCVGARDAFLQARPRPD